MTAVPCEWAVVLLTLLLVSGGDTCESHLFGLGFHPGA